MTAEVPAGVTPARGLGRGRLELMFAALAVAALVVVVMQSLVVPLLPSLAVEYDVSVTDATWVLTVNLIAAAVLTPLLSRVGDALGKQRVLSATLLVVLAGSLVASLTDSFGALLVGRVLQGAGFAAIPLGIALVRDVFPEQAVAGRVALLSAIMGIGGGAGLLITGLLSEAGAGPGDMFWVTAGASAVAALVVTTLVKDSGSRTAISFDLIGVVTLTAWLVCGLLGVDRVADHGSDDTGAWLLFGGTAVALAAWIFWESRTKDPMIDMRMLRKPVVLGTNLSAMLIGLGMFGAFVLINQFVQTPEKVGYGFSSSILEAGLILLPLTAGTIVAAIAANLLINSVGPKIPLVIGPLLAAGAFLALWQWHDEVWQFAVVNAVLGMGIGLSMASMPALINSAVPRSQTGVANGMNATFREVGGSIGSAVIASFLASETIPGLGLPTLESFENSFLLAAGLCGAAVLAAVLVPYRHRRTADATDVLDAGAVPEPVAPPTVAAEPVAVTSARHRAPITMSGFVIGLGGPVGGAVLTLSDLSGHQADRSTSAGDGSYRLSAGEPGMYLLVASAHNTPGGASHEPHAELVELLENKSHLIDIDSARPGGVAEVSVEGQVRSKLSGRPVARALVTVIDGAGQVRGSTRSDDEGRYRVTGLSAGELTITAAAYPPVTLDIDTTSGDHDLNHDVFVGEPVSGTAR